jgi:AraC-like DNA-binding protein
MDYYRKLSLILPSTSSYAQSGIMATDWYIRPYRSINHWQGAKPGEPFKGNITGYEQVEVVGELPESGILYPETCTAISFYCGPSKPYAFFSGIMTRPVVFSDLKPGTYFVVIFAPSQMHALFRMPLVEVSNQWVELETLRDFNMSLLIEKIACAPSFKARIAVWESFYRQWSLKHTGTMTSVIKQILDWSARNSGSVDEKTLSSFAGYTERHLRNMFHTYLGVTFKTYQRIIRYKKTLWALSTNATNLTDVAYDMGYYDQAHFIREFHHFQGSTPSCFLKEFVTSNPAD